MEDKVLYEMKVIETEKGYRVEVNGDKEQIRKMCLGPMMRFSRHHGRPMHAGSRGYPPRGPRRGGRPMRRRMYHEYGPWGNDWFVEEIDDVPVDEGPDGPLEA